MKNILIFSNPFGYGPTGKAIYVAEEFLRRYPLFNIVFVTKTFSKEIIPKNILINKINERDEFELENYLRKYKKEDTFIFSSQNRFPIKVANKLKIRCAFLDGLAWFWKEIPKDHFIADEIFWLNYPGMDNLREKLVDFKEKVFIIPSITDNKKILPLKIKNEILINIGGAQNPFKKNLQEKYLNLFGYLLYELSEKIKINIIISGSKLALNYIKKLYKFDKNIKFICMSHNKFINKLKEVKHFITTAGQTATLEAFSFKKPTSFILPMFLSQYGLTNYLEKYIDDIHQLKWSNYIKKGDSLLLMNEKESMQEIEKYSEYILNNSDLKKKILLDITKFIIEIPNIDNQNIFSTNVGINGAEKIVDILTKKWKLNK